MYTNLPSLLSSCDAEVLLCLEGEGRGGGGEIEEVPGFLALKTTAINPYYTHCFV